MIPAPGGGNRMSNEQQIEFWNGPVGQRFVDNQLRRSKAVLEAQIGQPVDMLAWPYGIVAPDLESAARNAGYRFAFAYEGGPARRGMDLLALPRVPVSEAVWGDGLAALVGLHATGKAP